MLIYDVLHKEKVYRSVASDLRDLGVKHRLKKNAIKSEKVERNRTSSRKVFKVSLSYQALDVVNLSSGAIVHVPVFVCQATAYLENFLFHEGLFRKAGSHARQKELIGRLDAGGTLGDKNHAIDVANCLKTFFRDLPEPLIPYAYHDLFVRCLVLRTRTVQALLLACILLPPLHLNTLAFFMGFLKKVCLHENLNKMSAENLATVIGPNIMPLQETTMSAVQARLEAHLVIVKLLIENADNIGVLPEHISETISAETIGSVETELDNSDPLTRGRNKKKKHRSGSLTRMFNGLKKMVGKSGSPIEVGQPNNQLVPAELDPLQTPLIKVGKKRKVLEPTVGPVSVKKKRDITNAMSTRTNQNPRILRTSPVCSNPKRIFDKVEKPKKMRMSLERLYSRSKQRIADSEMDESCKEPYSPCIERRWSSASGASASKKSRNKKVEIVKKGIESPLMRKSTTLVNVRDDYDRIFMEADVNLSDDCNEQATTSSTNHQGQSIRRTIEDKHIISHRTSNCRRSLDAFLLAATTKERTADNEKTPKHDKKLRSLCRRMSVNEFTKNSTKTLGEMSNVDSCILSKISTDEEYVRIPKSEYEEIKSRVSAIESRISQEFGCIANVSAETETGSSVSKVQNEYEKTLGEASIESTITADNLAKRLSKELKIRRSSEHKIIRSPSARKIGILRRRSQEKAPSRRVSRNASWHITQRTVSQSDGKNVDNRLNNVYQSPRRERGISCDYYQDQSRLQTDSLCSEETNARLNYLQEQLHTLINHTTEHTRGSFSDEDNCTGDDDQNVYQIETNTLNRRVRRASSFHGNEFIDNSRYFNNRVKELKKTNSHQNVCDDSRDDVMPKSHEKPKTISWKDAAGYFKSEVRSNFGTPVQQTGRASIAKLRTQNAGMVLAKAKLFDDNEIRKVCETVVDKKIQVNGEPMKQMGKMLPGSRGLKNHEVENTSPRKVTRRKTSKSPKNNNARMRITSSSNGHYSPVIKMELTILPSERESRQTPEKRATCRTWQNSEPENRSSVHSSNGKYENSIIRRDKAHIENIVTCDNEKFSKPRGFDENSSPATNFQDSNINVYNPEANSACKTPHIKRALGTKTPKSVRSLARRPIVDTRRTPLKAVPTLTTPKRHSPRNVLKSRHLSKPFD
ncbi:uncharacterized protein [Venturia canescens]|uniref:uncharacterized protein isoform X2 n=1 Tax=Venturia canescens TaxID=32260 RepID=UPI001C9D1128|nr:uncharacterized protein LOC122410086 isoform X2 [Venturia canescens]